MAATDDDDPRDFSLYGGPKRTYGERSVAASRTALTDSLLRDSKPCQPYTTKTGKKVKLPAIVALTAFELELLQEALSCYQREIEIAPHHLLQDRVEEAIHLLAERFKAMEGEP